jgi:hypothetical protein
MSIKERLFCGIEKIQRKVLGFSRIEAHYIHMYEDSTLKLTKYCLDRKSILKEYNVQSIFYKFLDMSQCNSVVQLMYTDKKYINKIPHKMRKMCPIHTYL